MVWYSCRLAGESLDRAEPARASAVAALRPRPYVKIDIYIYIDNNNNNINNNNHHTRGEMETWPATMPKAQGFAHCAWLEGQPRIRMRNVLLLPLIAMAHTQSKAKHKTQLSPLKWSWATRFGLVVLKANDFEVNYKT